MQGSNPQEMPNQASPDRITSPLASRRWFLANLAAGVTGSGLCAEGTQARGAPARDRAERPVYFHPFSHLEEITNVDEGHKCIRTVFELFRKYSVKFEANFHRYMAEDIRGRSPELLELMKTCSWALGYHPHPIAPLMPKYPPEERFDARVKRYIEHESSYVEWSTGELVREREDALALAPKVFGKKVMIACQGGHDAVASYALKRHFDVPMRLGGKGSILGPQKQYEYDDFLGRWTYLYWYMDNLFVKTPEHAFHQFSVDSQDLRRMLRNLPPDRMHILSISAGSDKASMMNHNALVNQQWKSGSNRLRDFPIPEDRRATPEQIQRFWGGLEDTLRFLRQGYLPSHVRSRVVTPEEIVQMVEPEVDRLLTRAQVASAANYIIRNWVARPPLYVDVGGEPISDTDAFQALWFSLAAYHKSGSLPKVVRVGGVLGPIGEQEDLLREPAARPEILDPKALLDAIAANPIQERVPLVLRVGSEGPALNAAQWLYLAALLYRDAAEQGRAGPVPHPGPAFILAMGAESHQAARQRIQGPLDRATWYELLQFWTVKPARIKAEFL